MRILKRVDAYWCAIVRTELDGFWFDADLRFHGSPGTKHLLSYRDWLYNKIFPYEPGKRQREREKRLKAIEVVVANLGVSISKLSAKKKHRKGTVIIPMGKHWWKDKNLSYNHIRSVVTYLESSRRIVLRRGFASCGDKEGRTTRMIPTQQLLDDLCGCFTRNEVEYYIATKPDKPVVLKDDTGHVVPYRDTAFVRKLIQDINQINHINSNFAITYQPPERGNRYPVNPFVYAVFIRNWKSAGRMYGGRHSHINMEQAVRETILIDGESICELDYQSLHISLLYNMVGLSLEYDPYTVVSSKSELRPLLKQILLSLINDKCSEETFLRHLEYRLLNRHTGVDKHKHVLAWEDAVTECKYNQKLLRKYNVTLPTIVQEFKKTHSPISMFFHAGVWATLQNIDSKIATEVSLALIRHKNPCLPRHDSYISQKPLVGSLEAAMSKAYESATKRLFGKTYKIGIRQKI